eukprot:scaffold6089_cov298-Prasinococcus_capsulatus_cf.AAC.3
MQRSGAELVGHAHAGAELEQRARAGAAALLARQVERGRAQRVGPVHPGPELRRNQCRRLRHHDELLPFLRPPREEGVHELRVAEQRGAMQGRVAALVECGNVRVVAQQPGGALPAAALRRHMQGRAAVPVA